MGNRFAYWALQAFFVFTLFQIYVFDVKYIKGIDIEYNAIYFCFDLYIFINIIITIVKCAVKFPIIVNIIRSIYFLNEKDQDTVFPILQDVLKDQRHN